MPLNWTQGEFALLAGPWVLVAAALGVAGLAGLLVAYRRGRYPDGRVRGVSFGLKGAALLLLLVPLLEPAVVVPDVVPDENFVAVLVDASASMSIPDGPGGATRAEAAAALLGGEGALVGRLEEHFQVRTYRFARRAARTDTLGGAPDGDATHLADALDRVLADFRGLPLRGVVLVTDGGDNGEAVPRNAALALRERDVPLHVVGVGAVAFAAERELLDAVVGKGVELTTGAEIDVKVRSWGEEPAPVAFNLYRGDDLVLTETRALKGEGGIDQFTLFYEPDGVGAEAYTLEVAAAPDEQNTINNTLPLLIDARRDSLRVLYLEGHLRRDFKFTKRALEDDDVIDFTSIARTGTGKYFRQGVRTPDELAGGFPGDEQELYGFRAVVLGDIEAAAFTPAQLAMLERFVRVRGGGLLMTGGRNAFAEGDYWNTPLADVLPVALDPARRSVLPRTYGAPGDPPYAQGFAFVPTAGGLESPILKLSPDPALNRARWAELPGLTSLNLLGPVKPGATVLAEKPAEGEDGAEPVLTVHRYGKGRAAALATASTWRWQMLRDAEDVRHERFWRQLVRWLAADAPGRVGLDVGDRFTPGAAAELSVTVYDDAYAPLPGAAVRAVVTGPDGDVRELDLTADVGRTGVYTAVLTPTDEGVYTVDVAAADPSGAPRGADTRSFLVHPPAREFYDAALKETALRDLAATASGAYWAPGEAEAIPAALRGRRTSTSVYHASYLWDHPLLYLLILTLLSAEWFYRRRRGLA